MQICMTEIDGLKIRYLEEGSGPPVLLLHGGTLGFSADMWRRNLSMIAEHGYRVIAYDQPGFGRSDAPLDFGIGYRQNFIDLFLSTLNIVRPTLIGHSQAGGLVVAAALNNPSAYSGIVVLGTGSLLPPLTGGQARDVEPPEKEPTPEETRALLESTLSDHSVITPQVLADYYAMSTGQNFRNAVSRAQAAAGQVRGSGGSLWQKLGDISIPSLFIYGADDKGQAAERIAIARERYPNLIFYLLEKCHHIVQWDRPEEVERLVTSFLGTLKIDA